MQRVKDLCFVMGGASMPYHCTLHKINTFFSNGCNVFNFIKSKVKTLLTGSKLEGCING
jgi:anaerobic ribonucleoside-triphosphate reductase